MPEQACIDFNATLPSDEEAVLSMLKTGRQAATSSTEIIRRTGLTERKVQQVIRKLRLEGHAIGAAVEPPMGYYIAVTQDELASIAGALSRRALKILAMAARFSKRSLRMEFDNAEMAYEKEGKQA